MFKNIVYSALILSLVGCGDKADIDQKTLLNAFPQSIQTYFEVEDIKLNKTNQEGNYSIYNTKGNLITKSPLFQEVISIGDKIIYKELMPKGTTLSFSSTLQAQGSHQTGWKLRYGNFILDKEIAGLKPLSEITGKSALFVGDKNFKPQIQQLEERYVLYQKKYPELVSQREALKNQLVGNQQQINEIAKNLRQETIDENQKLRAKLNEYWNKHRSAKSDLSQQQNKEIMAFNAESGKELKPLIDNRSLLARSNMMIVDGQKMSVSQDEAKKIIAELDDEAKVIRERHKAEKDKILARFKEESLQLDNKLKEPATQMEEESQKAIDDIKLRFKALTDAAEAQRDATQAQLTETNKELLVIERFTAGFERSLTYLKSNSYY